MLNVQPEDIKGQPLYEGDFVVYTVNSRDSGLKFGIIDSIKETQAKTYNGQIVFNHTIRMRVADAYGKPKNVQNYDWQTKVYTDTGVARYSGYVSHSKGKFLKL